MSETPVHFYEELYKKSKLNSQRLYPNEEFIRFFSKFLKNKKDIKVIELGSGLASNLIPLIEEGIDVYGIDISLESIKLAQERIDKLGLKASLEHCDCLKDNFGFNIIFDAVIDVFSMNCLNTSDFQTLLKNVYNNLKPGGLFYFF